MNAQVPLVIKVGGACLEQAQAQQNLFQILAQLLQKRPVVLVHGGGNLAQAQLAAQGLESVRHNGLRVTPKAHLDTVVGALAGAANKQLIAQAKIVDVPAVGISVADGNLAQATMQDPILGHVGQIDDVNPALLEALWQGSFLPVVSSIGVDAQGQLLNINADDAASAIAKALNAAMVYLSDVAGVWDAQRQVLAQTDWATYETLHTEQVIEGGMAVKVQAALNLSKALQQPVHIGHWQASERLLDLSQGKSPGTLVVGYDSH